MPYRRAAVLYCTVLYRGGPLTRTVPTHRTRLPRPSADSYGQAVQQALRVMTGLEWRRVGTGVHRYTETSSGFEFELSAVATPATLTAKGSEAV